MKLKIVFLLFLPVALFGQVQAVYDATLHQQTVLNTNALVQSHTQTREWLTTILQQIQINANAFVDCHNFRLEELKKLNEYIGDPQKLRLGVDNIAQWQTYQNKDLDTIRQSAVNAIPTDNSAGILYGENKKIGAAENVVEISYNNYETVLRNTVNDKKRLYAKREALVNALDQLTNVSQIQKVQAAIVAIDSKLQSIADIEQNAALKVLATQARNAEKRQLQKTIEEEASAEVTAEALSYYSKTGEANLEAVLKELESVGKSK